MFPCDQLLYGELERKGEVDTVKYVVIETEKMRESRERMVRRRRSSMAELWDQFIGRGSDERE